MKMESRQTLFIVFKSPPFFETSATPVVLLHVEEAVAHY